MKKIEYINFNERGLKPVADEFKKKHGIEVTAIKADNMPKREDGQQIKTATFILAGGQKLMVKIKSNGTIFQAKLNGKVVPVKAADDLQDPKNLAKAIKEMATYVKKNENAYEAKQKQVAKRVVSKEKKATTSKAKQLETLQNMLADAEATGKAMMDELTDYKTRLEASNGEIARLRAELEKEQARNQTLTAELNDLLKEAA